MITFLNRINPYFNKIELESKLGSIVVLMNRQIDYRINGLYDLDIENFDKLISESIIFSNILTEGIISQHPKRFL